MTEAEPLSARLRSAAATLCDLADEIERLGLTTAQRAEPTIDHELARLTARCHELGIPIAADGTVEMCRIGDGALLDVTGKTLANWATPGGPSRLPVVRAAGRRPRVHLRDLAALVGKIGKIGK